MDRVRRTRTVPSAALRVSTDGTALVSTRTGAPHGRITPGRVHAVSACPGAVPTRDVRRGRLPKFGYRADALALRRRRVRLDGLDEASPVTGGGRAPTARVRGAALVGYFALTPRHQTSALCAAAALTRPPMLQPALDAGTAWRGTTRPVVRHPRPCGRRLVPRSRSRASDGSPPDPMAAGRSGSLTLVLQRCRR